MAALQSLVQPARTTARWKCGYSTRPSVHGRVVQVQVVVGDAAVPVGAGRRAGNVVHGLQRERDRAAGLQGRVEVGRVQRHLAGAVVVRAKRQRLARVENTTRSSQAPMALRLHRIGEEGPQVTQRRAQAVLAPQQWRPREVRTCRR